MSRAVRPEEAAKSALRGLQARQTGALHEGPCRQACTSQTRTSAAAARSSAAFSAACVATSNASTSARLRCSAALCACTSFTCALLASALRLTQQQRDLRFPPYSKSMAQQIMARKRRSYYRGAWT